MNWVILSILIIFLIVSLTVLIQKHKDWRHPTILFNLLWFFACLLLIINPNEYYEVSYKTILITLVGAFCFNIPAYLETHIARKYRSKQVSIELGSIKKSKLKTLFWIQIVLMVLMIPLSIRALGFISIYGFAFMRNIYADSISYGYMSTLERMVYIHYIVFPLIKALSLVQLIMYVRGNAKRLHLFQQ